MRTHSRTQGGAAIAELVVVLPALLMLGLGVLQSALFYQAKTTVTYATFEAARKGAVTHAQRVPMLDEFGLRLAPIFGGDGSASKASLAIAKGKQETSNPAFTRIDILNPTRQAFTDFGSRNAANGKLEIPNTHLRFRDFASIGSNSGVNVQDANLLKIRTIYGFELKVPLISGAITNLLSQFNPANAAFYEQGRVPITAVATVRMQSEAWEDGNWNADGTAPGNGTVPNGELDERSPSEGDTDGDGIPDEEDGDIDGDGIANDHDADANGNGVPDVEESEESADKEETLCENPTIEEDTKGAGGNEDSGFWGELWSGVKDAVVEGYEFVKGFWAGLKQQLSDLADLVLHPIETAKGLAALGKMLIEDFQGTITQIGEALGRDFTNLTQCGAYDRGRVIGEYASPAFVVKLASKLSKYGTLARSLDETRKDFGCASFASGTPIWLANGSLPIERVTANHAVLSRSDTAFTESSETVIHTFGRTAEAYYALTTEFETLHVTAEHPFWVQGKGWREASLIETNDVISALDTDVLVLSNDRRDQAIEVFNFSVDRTKSYFVGEGKLWAHNADPKCNIDAGNGPTIDGIKHTLVEVESYNGKNKGLNKPQPYTVYRVNGRHEYRTDGQGRTVSVKTTIESKDLDTTARNYYRQCKQGKCGNADDEGGHIIATKLGGPGETINLVPQNRNLNRSLYRKLEIELANAALDGKRVEVDVELKYTGATARPDSFVVRYTIDGGREIERIFTNQTSSP